MTSVYCSRKDCTSNADGLCIRKEITLEEFKFVPCAYLHHLVCTGYKKEPKREFVSQETSCIA